MNGAYYFEEYRIGEEFDAGEIKITLEDIKQFAQLTHDTNPLHTDKIYAIECGYKDIISHGLLCVSLCSGIAYKSGLFDRRVIGLVSQTIKYKRPVYVGERLRFILKVINKREIPYSRGGLVVFDTRLVDEENNVLISGEWSLLIEKKVKNQKQQEGS
ncbi:MAG: MaoC family dehydratase [Planctomycetota bacterium]